jgi:ATP-dependent exoDNAse (exonuclease V) beta subunit
LTASEWSRSERPGGDLLESVARKVDILEAPAPRLFRPSGRRFGVLVHALLAAVPLNAKPGEIARMATVHARLLGADEEERAAAALAVEQALGHPLLAGARAAESAGRACRHEVPLSVVVSGIVIDGQADLVWDDGDGWVIVDFKTDVEVAGAEDVYRWQVASYVEAIRRATGRPARGVLLRV